MTLEEAKKLLKKEGFHIQVKPDGVVLDRTFHPFEKPSVKEAVKVLFDNGLMTCMNGKEAIERSSRLFKEHNWVPVDKNPASNESVKEFNDALLDKQAKKISAYQKQFKHLAEVLHKKNIKIEQLRKESSKHLRDKIKVFYENQELEKKASKYANKLADACCELRELKEKLAKITVNNVDAQALKSAEHALVEKDAIIQEKDEVIEDLGKELAETKKKIEAVKVDTVGKCMKAFSESINSVFESYATRYAKSTIDELKDEAYKRFNKRAADLGFIGSKDGNGILGRMDVKVDLGKGELKTSVRVLHAEDNPEDANPRFKIYVEDKVWDALGRERNQDLIQDYCREMAMRNIKLMRDLFDE